MFKIDAKGRIKMSYNCFVFEHSQQLINSIEKYKQQGGDETQLKILIKDIDHGQLLSASGLHHIDYLSEIIDANHRVEEQQHHDDLPRYFVGVTTGQNNPGVVNASFGQDITSATEVLLAYGLSEERASEALNALRAGHYLLFVPQQSHHVHSEHGHYLHDALSASFGEYHNVTSEQVLTIEGASYAIT